MAERVLVEDLIKAGELLTQSLERTKFPLVASFWLYSEESQRWRLMLASPWVDQQGPLKAYEKIQEAIRANPDLKPLTLNDIYVVTPRDELVRGLRMVLGSAASVQGVRLGGTRVNDQFVEDAYLYRLSPLRSSVSSSKTNHTKSKKLTHA